MSDVIVIIQQVECIVALFLRAVLHLVCIFALDADGFLVPVHTNTHIIIYTVLYICIYTYYIYLCVPLCGCMCARARACVLTCQRGLPCMANRLRDSHSRQHCPWNTRQSAFLPLLQSCRRGRLQTFRVRSHQAFLVGSAKTSPHSWYHSNHHTRTHTQNMYTIHRPSDHRLVYLSQPCSRGLENSARFI